jgi:hypothetical protein
MKSSIPCPVYSGLFLVVESFLEFLLQIVKNQLATHFKNLWHQRHYYQYWLDKLRTLPVLIWGDWIAQINVL